MSPSNSLRNICLALALLLFATPLAGQNARRRVEVRTAGDDAVGASLAYAVREELRRSAGYELVSDRAEFAIDLVSVDEASRPELRGNASAVAAAFSMTNYLPLKKGDPQTWYAIYLTTSVYSVGAERVADIARSVVARLDASVQEYYRDAKR